MKGRIAIVNNSPKQSILKLKLIAKLFELNCIIPFDMREMLNSDTYRMGLYNDIEQYLFGGRIDIDINSENAGPH